MTLDEFVKICAGNGLALDHGQVLSYAAFVESLEEWNTRVNLVSRKDIAFVWERHVLHSVALLFHTTLPQGSRVIDIGTGGGFPGIPLKIARPDLRMVLVDSIHKKMLAVDAMISILGDADPRMSRLETICARVEDVANMPGRRNAFDLVIARAVAPLEELIALAIPLLAPKGRLLALKGGVLDAEIINARRQHPELTYVCRTLSVNGAPEFEVEAKQLVEVQW